MCARRSYFSKEYISKKKNIHPTSHFENVSGPFLQLMGTEYESLEEFSVQLERLKVFIEFMMAMPAISQDMALDTYSGLMQKEDQVTGGVPGKARCVEDLGEQLWDWWWGWHGGEFSQESGEWDEPVLGEENWSGGKSRDVSVQ